MLYSLVLPFFNHWDLTHRRMAEFYKHLPPENLEILLIDNGSTDKEIDGGVAFWQKHVNKHTIRYFKKKENVGFGGAMNFGASKADGDALILYSNDVVCSGNFLAALNVILTDRVLIGNDVFDWDTGWNTIPYVGNKMIVPYANGHFLACTKPTWELLGGFDPAYYPYDYEDVDLSTNAQAQGIKLLSLSSPFLHHIGGGTIGYNPDRENITREHREYWLKKWDWDKVYSKV